ncbi:MAG: hypothetical protein NZM37_00515 [Sandaracinaceae bacterium]|nr:hypothetical protein [Sandaracinaceae bacterium]
MRRAISWIDPREAAALVAGVLPQKAQKEQKDYALRRRPLRIASLEAEKGTEVLSKEEPKEAEPRPPEKRETLSPGASQGEPKLPELNLEGMSLFARIQALGDWIDAALRPSSILLADEFGLLVHGVRARAEYGAVMAPLLSAMNQLGQVLPAIPSRGSLFVRDHEFFSWVEHRGSLGRFSLGISSNAPIQDALLEHIQKALVLVLEGDSK